MDTNIEVFKGKSFQGLCEDIYTNSANRREQIEVVIADLRPLIKTAQDALMIVPLIKGYLDTANTNDEHLIKLAQIIQRIMTAQANAVAEGGSFALSEDEKKALMGEINAIADKSKAIVIDKQKKED